MTMITTNLNAALLRHQTTPWDGRRETTDVKIRIDMPLPMPRWVMSSPSHMTSAVPAVHVRTIMHGLAGREVRDEPVPCGSWKPDWPSSPPLPLFSTNTNAGRLHRARARR